MLSPELQATLQRAVEDVRVRRHEYLTLEHLLLAVLDDPSGVDIIVKCGGDVDKMRGEVDRFLDEEVDELPEGEELGASTRPSRCSACCSAPLMHVQAAGRQQMTTGNVIASMFRERKDSARGLPAREAQGVVPGSTSSTTSPTASRRSASPQPIVAAIARRPRGRSTATTRRSPTRSRAFCVDLTQRARDGKIDPLIGRADELERMIQVRLSRRRRGTTRC